MSTLARQHVIGADRKDEHTQIAALPPIADAHNEQISSPISTFRNDRFTRLNTDELHSRSSYERRLASPGEYGLMRITRSAPSVGVGRFGSVHAQLALVPASDCLRLVESETERPPLSAHELRTTLVAGVSVVIVFADSAKRQCSMHGWLASRFAVTMCDRCVLKIAASLPVVNRRLPEPNARRSRIASYRLQCKQSAVHCGVALKCKR